MNKKKLVIATVAAGAFAGIVFNVKKKKDDKKIERGIGQTALITGASSGIGLEFVKVFAIHGFDLVITARSLDKLEVIAKEIQAEHGVKVTVIPADLSSPDGAQKLYDEVLAKGIEISQLVNCAGAGKSGRTVDVVLQDMVDLIHLNVVSVTLLCKLFGADMEKRGEGKILNVSSLGAFIPDPFFNVYGPTKAYELFLSEAMSGEFAGSGVTVSVLCPGPTKTNWTKNAGKVDSQIALEPKDVARVGFEEMQKGKLVIIPSIFFKAGKVLMGLLPPEIQVAFIRKWQTELIQKEHDKINF